MKIFLFVLLLSFATLISSCQGSQEKFEPMVENIKRTVLKEVVGIKKIDTVYLLIKTMTPSEKMVIQAMEYAWASTEAKKEGNQDSSYYESTSNKLLTQAGKIDSTTFLYYIGAALVIFTDSNFQKGMIDKRMFFDDKLNVAPKYSIFQKIAKTDNLETQPIPFEPFGPEEYELFEKKGILKYY